MGSCAAPSAKGDDKFITTDYLQQCQPVATALAGANRRGVAVRVVADEKANSDRYTAVTYLINQGGHCCKVSDEAAFCLIQRPYISKTLLTRRISPRGSP